MSLREYQRLNAEYRRQDRLYPDRGHSQRPWEAPLRARLAASIRAGLARKAAWARAAAPLWGVEVTG